TLANNALEVTAAILDRAPDVGVVYGDYLVIDTEDRVQGLGIRCNIPYSQDRLLIDFMTFQFRLLRRELFDRVGGIDLEFRSAEDYDLCLKLSEITNFDRVRQPLYHYRAHAQSISQSTQSEQLEYSVKAIGNALLRRGLSDSFHLHVTPQGQFQLLPQATSIHNSPQPEIAAFPNLTAVVIETGIETIAAELKIRTHKSISLALNSFPKVSCVMVTKDRLEFVKQAIFCFGRQTYPDRELVIIDNSSNNEIAEYLDRSPYPQIAYYRYPSPDLSLGELRNLSIAKATGDYIAQWDDDDLYDPLRLELQMAAIAMLKVDCCFLDSLYLWWPHQQRLARSFTRLWEGTIVCSKEVFPIYPKLQRGEDSSVTDLLIANYRIVALNRPDLYIYGCHQQNTWDSEHFDIHWQGAQAKFTGDDCDLMLQKLAQRLPIENYLTLLSPRGDGTKSVYAD
ncbi:MAG: glycosyltransferase, partial [Chamaesiphon sp. CSU_1_12]|nr:glycosyltransferase [Chamaesiphon sp. CSU_1_12]